MSSDWEWPGARWWRCDLHVHTPESKDFPDEATAEEWVQVALDAGLSVVAVLTEAGEGEIGVSVAGVLMCAAHPERWLYGARIEAVRYRGLEQRGEGVPIILRESRELAGRAPEYRLIDDAELLLTIWSAPPPV